MGAHVSQFRGKRSLGIFISRWKDNIKIVLRGIGCRCVDRFHVVLDRH
jgi:hypothetical protein